MSITSTVGTTPADPLSAPPPRRRQDRSNQQRREAIALVIPSLVPIIIFSVLPLVQGVWYAFTDATLRRNDTADFVGLENFGRLAGDSFFWSSFRIGMIWAVSVTLIQLVAALGLALLLNSNLRFRSLTRLLALIPWAMPPVVVAIMWTILYAPNGPINSVLGTFGLPDDTNWLGNFDTALPAVIVVGVWVGMPQTTVTLLAGLQQIPTELVEAAAVDGASAWQRFRNVVLPSLRPIIVSITCLNFIWNFNSFGLVYVMTEGGPGGQTMLPMLFTYLEAFKNRNLGYAAAMGVVLVIVVILILAGVLRSQFKKERS